MRNEFKVMVAFIVSSGILYMLLLSGLSVGISKLNMAREDELRAATLQLEMSQRLNSTAKDAEKK